MELDVIQLKQELEQGVPLTVLDVREPYELEISKLDMSLDIPMGQIPQRLDELDRQANIAVLCRSGQRSANVQAFLLENGFDKVRNITGGILAWAEHNDPGMPKY